MAEELDTKTTFRMPQQLHKRFRVVLAHDGRSAQEILNGMVESWVRRKEGEIESGLKGGEA